MSELSLTLWIVTVGTSGGWLVAAKSGVMACSLVAIDQLIPFDMLAARAYEPDYLRVQVDGTPQVLFGGMRWNAATLDAVRRAVNSGNWTEAKRLLEENP